MSLNIPGTSSLVVIPEANPLHDSVHLLRTGAPVELAADPVHHLALVLYSTPPLPARFDAAPADSNSMSVIDVVDIRTGRIVKAIEHFSSPVHLWLPVRHRSGDSARPGDQDRVHVRPG